MSKNIRFCLERTAKKHELSRDEVMNILLQNSVGKLQKQLKQIKRKYEQDLNKVIQNIETYSDLLSFGQKVIEGKFNITGLEEETINSGKYYDQLKAINKYMFTTGSTNLPEDPTFQPMFLEGILLKSSALKLANCAREYGFNFIIQKVPKGKIIDSYIIGFDEKESIITPNEFDSLVENGVGNLPDENEYLMSKKLFQGSNPIVGIIIEDPVGITPLGSTQKYWQRRLFAGVLNCLQGKESFGFQPPKILLKRN